jgi:hypothetical protein
VNVRFKEYRVVAIRIGALATQPQSEKEKSFFFGSTASSINVNNLLALAYLGKV